MARILGCQAKEPFANVGALSDIESCQSQALEGAKPRLAQKMICADFLTSRTVKLAPDNDEVKKLRDEVVKLLGLKM
jgi:hypothetical protein